MGCAGQILFGLEHDTRRVHLLGITDQPNADWLANVLRSATDAFSPLADRKYWIHDNDGKFQGTLKRMFKAAGRRSVNIVPLAPNMNSLAERFVKSIREECLDRIPFLTGKALAEATHIFVEHYNTERPHQGVDNVPLSPWEVRTEGQIVCDTKLGGLLKSYRRAA